MGWEGERVGIDRSGVGGGVWIGMSGREEESGYRQWGGRGREWG